MVLPLNSNVIKVIFLCYQLQLLWNYENVSCETPLESRQSCLLTQLWECVPHSMPVGWLNVDATCRIPTEVLMHCGSSDGIVDLRGSSGSVSENALCFLLVLLV